MTLDSRREDPDPPSPLSRGLDEQRRRREDERERANLILEVRSKLTSLEQHAVDAYQLASRNAALLELLGGQLGELREAVGEIRYRLGGAPPCTPAPGWDNHGEITRAKIQAVIDEREVAKDAKALRAIKSGWWKLWLAGAAAACGLAVKLLWHKLFG